MPGDGRTLCASSCSPIAHRRLPFDMLVYVCGRKPVQTDSWLPEDQAAPEYTGGRALEAVEVQLDGFDEVLVATYPAHVVTRG